MQSCLRSFIFVFVFFFVVSGKSQRHEICQFISQDSKVSNDRSVTKLDLNTLSITQNSCVKYFSLDLSNPLFKDKYVTVEVDFYDLPEISALYPKFLQKTGSKPQLYFDSKSHSHIQEDANALDSNAFLNRKTYHHIVLNPEEIKQGGTSYFALYKASSIEEDYYDGQIGYKINVKTSDAFPCPQGCSNNGVCSQEQKKCICNEGFFDLDCSVQATPLVQDKAGSQLIDSKQWKYFYFRMDNGLEDVIMSIGKSGGSVKLSFKIGNLENFFLPNFYHSEGSYTLAPEQNSLELSITRPLLTDESQSQLVMGVYNTEDEPVTVGIQIESFDEDEISKSTVLLIAIGVFLGLLTLLTTMIFMKYRSDRRMIELADDQMLKKKAFLTKEEVEKYFPKTKYNQLKSSFSQTLCSVCLEDFNEDSSCRQLYCEHIYHDSCIEAWVTKHDNCPNCKKNITKEAIEGHLNTQNQEQKDPITIPIAKVNTTQQPDSEQQTLLASLDTSSVCISVKE